MKLILDTHFIIWLADDPRRLSSAERTVLREPGHDFVVSAASVWEVRLKWDARSANGRRKGVIGPEAVIELVNDLRFRFMPVTELHAASALRVPLQHRDPFDELLVVQAQVEDMRLMTRDGQLVDHPLAFFA